MHFTIKCFSLYDEVSKNCKVTVVQISDQFLLIIYIGTDSDCVKFVRHDLRDSGCSHFVIVRFDVIYRDHFESSM
jgi:hypothetical protein